RSSPMPSSTASLSASLHEAIAAHSYASLHELAEQVAAQDLADALQELPLDEQVLTFRTLSRRKAATVFEYLPLACQRDLVKQVLDYVREHGKDSETLNVIYVIDDAGMLIDDIRMREFLVRPLEDHVSQLMDRRYVTLKATDREEEAVAIFRREDRTALPVL